MYKMMEFKPLPKLLRQLSSILSSNRGGSHQDISIVQIFLSYPLHCLMKHKKLV